MIAFAVLSVPFTPSRKWMPRAASPAHRDCPRTEESGPAVNSNVPRLPARSGRRTHVHQIEMKTLRNLILKVTCGFAGRRSWVVQLVKLGAVYWVSWRAFPTPQSQSS